MQLHFHPLMAIAGLLWLSACSGTESDIKVPGPASTPVCFSALTHWDTLQTRLTEDANSNAVSFTKDDAIGVFAYHNGSATPNFMNNQKVTYDGTSWEYSPIKYWPTDENDKVDFYAYYPHSDANPQISVSNTSDGAPCITYDNIKADTDWMAAKCDAMNHGNGKDGVSLNLRHLLARVKFTFTVVGNSEYHPVIHVLKYNIPHHLGTIDFTCDESGAFICQQTCDSTTVQITRYTDSPEGKVINTEGIVIPEFTAYLLPCSFPCTDDMEEIGEFTISLNNIEHKCKPSDFITVHAGKSYTMNFNIKPSDDGASSNYFITSYTLWEDGGDYEENLK